MKRFSLLLLALALILPTMADTTRERVAVFDPSGTTKIDEGARVAIREIISSTIVNSGKYNIVERSMLERVMQEQTFSNSGAVDDNQATEIGKLAGANKVVVSVITTANDRMILSIKMIDVKTANVEKQKVRVITSKELLDVIESITLELIDAKRVIVANPKNVAYTPASEKEVQEQPKQVQETKKPKEEFVYRKGYKGFAEVGFGLGTGWEEFVFSGSLYTTHGYQCSPYFFIGGGLGTELVFDDGDIGTLFVFGEMRVNLRNPKKYKNTSYLGLRSGYEVLNSTGAMLNLFWGRRWPIRESLALNFNLGYEFLSRSYIEEESPSKAYEWTDHLLSLRLGIEF